MARIQGKGRSESRHHRPQQRRGGQKKGEARPGGKPRFDRKADDRKGKPGQGHDGPRQKPQRPREERQARVDPDSPFAKLAALREQLKK